MIKIMTEVKTNPCTDITLNSATLNGEVVSKDNPIMVNAYE